MDRDESTGQWQCPVLNKPFTNRSKVIAIRQRPPGNEANVISYEAYHELNLKAKSNLDLISGKKFTKDDVITLQDPDNKAHCKLRDIQNFSHMRSLREENSRQQSAAGSSNVKHSVTASRIMEKLEREKRKRERAAEDQAKRVLKTDNDAGITSSKAKEQVSIYTDELLLSMNLTSGKASGSLTSTTMNITRENKARLATQEEIITSQCEQLKRLKKKGMVRMFTNQGAMDIELHCDIVPRTAMNFLLLVEKGEYDGSKFHRSIPNFMIQGGKKRGSTGSDGGSSIWGKPFADEFDDRLTHAGSGIVSMANSGPTTNGRQFFITYKSCAHLNRKHSVFGKVVGGMEILSKMEEIPTDERTDRPLDTIKIESMEILDNPVTECLKIERERIQEKKEEKRKLDQSRKSSALGRGSSSARDIPSKSNALPSPNADEDDSKHGGPPPFVIGKYLKKVKKESKKRAKHTKTKSDDGNGADSVGESVISR
eukprot:CAMPEP_0172538688 /NCGR_PEP_ID=MMETSP1067-20121228/10030_1 /TAXON_ID=265564 ORGANISM="Thalassiosira punctigera, Strain Tpunct2005C2" /NCGR_SAMPLE_ID=MMETSP1067 /ASSEMBLY_ACC=CAM_ASM_000444 /LENGTH=483 /DNA_ID=CAMNT_0013324235 /DNA_START=273 /DNA_END=1721 /DNA_ORIENTATION=+